ncbi:MAG: nitroreductase family protein [Bacteroidota bacterium]|nr:nitroreductase family protein [Bacteroidota bacterium]
MNFIDLVRSRYSCRSFTSVPVEEDNLLKIMEAVRIAPSAVNYQPWHFIIVREPEVKALIVEAYPREWFRTAPLMIVACGDHTKSWKRTDGKDFLDIDLSIAIEHLVLQATELGLGTCWVCNFNAGVLSRNLNLPDHIEPIAVIPIGYPADSGDITRYESKRKSLNDFVHWEKFSSK